MATITCRFSRTSIGAMLAVLFALTTALGCHPPKAVPTYEFVTRYDRMDDRYEPLASLAYVSPDADVGSYRAVVIAPFRLGEEWIRSESWAVGYAAMMRVLLRQELSKLHAFDVVTFQWDEAEHGPPYGVLALEGMLTRFKMGSGFLRYMSGLIPFMTAGATDLQVAGRLKDAETGEVLLEFVDRRRGIYNTPWGANPKNFKAGFAMSHTVLDTALSLAGLIGRLHQGLPAPESGDETDH